MRIPKAALFLFGLPFIFPAIPASAQKPSPPPAPAAVASDPFPEEVPTHPSAFGRITGTVTDADGLPLPNVKVHIHGVNGADASTTTDSSGEYSHREPASSYTVTASFASSRTSSSAIVRAGEDTDTPLVFSALHTRPHATDTVPPAADTAPTPPDTAPPADAPPPPPPSAEVPQ
jgi:hypothetical protein